MPLPTLALDDWKPVSRLGALVSISFYILFLLYAAASGPHFLFLDFANLMIHEAGHPLFGILGGGGEDGFGRTLMVLGGTLLELIVPFVCAVYFFFQRQAYGTAFCGFWFSENLLYIANYMSDARTASQPLVGGDESDWTILFTQWNVLVRDTQIAAVTRTIGWLGMLAAVAWFAYRAYRNSSHDPL
jgi:hypothetical protein